MKSFTKTLILLLLFLYSCSPKLTNLDFVKEDIIKYYESGEYDKEVGEATTDAIKKFEAIKVEDSSAVVFDVDETALSNYEIIKEMDFGYIKEPWDKWIEEAKAPAISEVKDLYNSLIARGIKIIFITGRKDYQYFSTYNNLHSSGYSLFDTLIVREKDEYKLGASDYKTKKRKQLSAKGYKIVGTVGDQWSDLIGENLGIPVKIPNYLYIVE